MRSLPTAESAMCSEEVFGEDGLQLVDGTTHCERRPAAPIVDMGQGPRILFFSGGTALDGLSRVLTRFTHNSVHLITPFDSGGSSARLRDTFRMLSVGDLRSRLLSLAEQRLPEGCGLHQAFAHRFASDATQQQLRRDLFALVDGSHPLLRPVPVAERAFLSEHALSFQVRCPADFDLRGANIGNLLLAGCYLAHERDIFTTLAIFADFLDAKGVVQPSSCDIGHLAARLASGERVIGQSRFTGKQGPALASPIVDIDFVADLKGCAAVELAACPEAIASVAAAELICYPMGSFYSSVACHLLLRGICRAIIQNPCPKVYVPNVGPDPEQLGMTLSDTVKQMLHLARRSGCDVRPTEILDTVLIDSRRANYNLRLDIEQVTRLGIRVLDQPLATSRDTLDPKLLAAALLALSG